MRESSSSESVKLWDLTARFETLAMGQRPSWRAPLGSGDRSTAANGYSSNCIGCDC